MILNCIENNLSFSFFSNIEYNTWKIIEREREKERNISLGKSDLQWL